ncbi:type II toxin-antitoxin system RelE/ParE family toxin [Geoalkalibacter subterraneus]|uniref:type II toxin-antitoxin system RelE/ParE family toxin n=1 Tax=Geoalkalibacter subterraneus TaxID=483547 RepID=UPI001F354274
MKQLNALWHCCLPAPCRVGGAPLEKVAHRIVWSPQALSDVEGIAEYIEQDSPFYARTVVARIVAATRNLVQFPMTGRVVPEMMDFALGVWLGPTPVSAFILQRKLQGSK